VAAERDAACVFTEANQLCVGPRPRRKTLRADVQRLEQIRLAGAVRAGDEDEARFELQVEPGVRADVPERDGADDQPLTSQRRRLRCRHQGVRALPARPSETTGRRD
jgi:hypothetical protein